MRALIAILLLACLSACSNTSAQNRTPVANKPQWFATVIAKRGPHTANVGARRMYQLLDFAGNLAYDIGFVLPTNGSPGPRPAKPFSRLAFPGDKDPYFIAIFQLEDGTATAILGLDENTIVVVFEEENHYWAEVGDPSESVRAARRDAMRKAVRTIVRYWRTHLPESYHITVTLCQPSTQ